MDNNKVSKRQYQKLQKLYQTGYSAYGSLNNLVQASGLSKDIVKAFLHSKESYTRYHNATRKFRRQKVFTRYINDVWCMDLAFVDKLANENNDIKCFLVAVDVFSRFVRVQPMKNKLSKTTKEAFQRFRKSPKCVWVDQGKEFGGEFKKFCDKEGIHIYHTYSETKASFAERAIRSLKRILYRFIEENDTFRYIGQLQQFVGTINARVNRSIGKAPKNVKNSDAIALHHLHTNRKQTIQDTKVARPKFKIGDTVQISKYDMPFRKGYKAQYTKEVFRINRIVSSKPVVSYELCDGNNDIIRGKFYEQEIILSKSLSRE